MHDLAAHHTLTQSVVTNWVRKSMLHVGQALLISRVSCRYRRARSGCGLGAGQDPVPLTALLTGSCSLKQDGTSLWQWAPRMSGCVQALPAVSAPAPPSCCCCSRSVGCRLQAPARESSRLVSVGFPCKNTYMLLYVWLCSRMSTAGSCVLQAQCILFARYPEVLAPFKYAGYPMLLDAVALPADGDSGDSAHFLGPERAPQLQVRLNLELQLSKALRDAPVQAQQVAESRAVCRASGTQFRAHRFFKSEVAWSVS